MSYPQEKPAGAGWAEFAGIWFFVSGIFHIISGVASLWRKEYFSEGAMLYENLQAYGWSWIVLGALGILVGYLILKGSNIGRILGLIVAVIAMVDWFFAIGAYPWWGIIMIVLNGGIIYGLTAGRDLFD